MNPQFWWFLARASGLVAWSLLTVTVVWGVLLRTRLLPRWRSANLFPLHRFLAGLAVLFTAAHLAALLLDSYIRFGPADVFIPFAASWRPVPVALGVLALYVMVAVTATSAAMRHLPRRWWSRVHLMSYAMFWFATAHAATAGTDSAAPVTVILLAAAGGAVLFGTLVRILSPDAPAPVVRRASPDTHQLTVRQIDRQGPDAVSVTIGVPAELRELFRARPGQHVLIRRPGDDLAGPRAYSVYAADAEGLHIAVRRVPGGRTSTWVTTELRPGDRLEVSAPRGTFGVTADPSQRRHVLAVGGGSGVTPLLAIAAAVLGGEPESRVTFLLANRSSDRVMLRRELDELVRRHPHRFRLLHVLDRDAGAGDLAGPLDAALLRRVAERLELAGVDEAYLCGPGPMMDGVRSALGDLGVDGARVHREQFSAPIPAARADSPAAGPGTAGPAHCTVVVGGRSVPVAVTGSDSVLDAGLRAGLPLPYSCRAGYCGTCAAVVSPAAVGGAAGAEEVVHTCQMAAPTAPMTVDFDRAAVRAGGPVMPAR